MVKSYFSYHGPELLNDYPYGIREVYRDHELKLIGRVEIRTDDPLTSITRTVHHRWSWDEKQRMWKLSSFAPLEDK